MSLTLSLGSWVNCALHEFHREKHLSEVNGFRRYGADTKDNCYGQNDGLTDEGHSSARDEVGVSFDRSSLVFETATEFCFQMTSV